MKVVQFQPMAEVFSKGGRSLARRRLNNRSHTQSSIREMTATSGELQFDTNPKSADDK